MRVKVEKYNIIVDAMVLFLGIAIFFSGSKNYQQIAVGVTYVTLPLIFILPLFLFYLIINFYKIRFAYIDGLAFSILFLAGASLFWTLSPMVWSNNFFWYTVCILFFIITRILTQNIFYLKRIFIYVFLGIGFTFFNLKLGINEYGIENSRYSIDGLNENFTAYVLAGLAYLLCIGYISKIVKNKWLVIIFNIVCFTGVFLLQTRGALISMLLMWFLVVFYNREKNIIFSTYVYIVIFLSFALTFGFINNIFNFIEGLFFRERVTGDLSGRMPVWSQAYKFISENFLLGIGIGSFSEVNEEKIGAHNFFLNYLLDMGVIGLFLFLSLLIYIFLINNKFYLSGNRFLIFGAFILFWFPIATSGNWGLAPFFWILMALTYNIMRIENV